MKKLTIFLSISLIFNVFLFANDDFQTLDLLFVGDIMGHDGQIESAYDATTKKYDYKPCFKYVKPIISKADLAIGNLEVTLSDQGRYTGYPIFRTPDALADALKGAGFDMLVTANNHSNDNRVYGVTHTLDVLDELGFYHTGTFRNQGEKDLLYPLIVYKNGFKLAFLNYTYGTNGIKTRPPTVVNEIDQTKIEADIETAEKMKPDAIIVVMHWGLEYQLTESKDQYNLAKKMFEWGANLIVGAHPHVIQPIKKIPFENKKGELKEGLCVFSMGNFISDQQTYNTDGGLMVEIQLTKVKGENRVEVADCQYIPVWRYNHYWNKIDSIGTFYALPISAFEEEQIMELSIAKYAKQQMINFGTRMRKHLAKYQGKERLITLKELGIKSSQKTGHMVSKNPYAVLASYRDSLITPLERDNYIIYDTDEVPTKPKVNQKPTLPTGSVKKGDEEQKAPKKPTTSTNTTTQPTGNTASQNPTDKYLVQIQSTRSLYASSLPFQNVIVQEVKGYFRYYLAAGNTLDEARAALTTVHEAGFKDAYVVLNKLEEDKKKASDNTIKSGNSVVYKIQFQSSTKLAVPQKLPINEYEVVETTDGRFRYFAGKVDTITEALDLLKTIQSAGYQDAFVVQFENGKPKE